MANFKVESGLQLLARLTKKPDVQKFYPNLFGDGPKLGEIVEVMGDSGSGKSLLLADLISVALLPVKLGGIGAEILLINTDGNISLNSITRLLKQHLLDLQPCKDHMDSQDLQIQEILQRMHYIEVYDANQFYVTLQNSENVFVQHPDISLVLFDTLTAYYWSEQGLKISKMDIYLKNILKMVHKIAKEFKITAIYTRPTYFNSSKEIIEISSKLALHEVLDYKIHLSVKDTQCPGKEFVQVEVRTADDYTLRSFRITDSKIHWNSNKTKMS